MREAKFGNDLPPEITSKIVDELSHQFTDEIVQAVMSEARQAAAECSQSPIETLFLVAFFAVRMLHNKVFKCWTGKVVICADPKHGANEPPACFESMELCDLVIPQAIIDIYRADFLIRRFEKRDGEVVASAKVVVECDGEEFHNPERDRRRDWIIKSLGYRVIRFTGKELYRNPIGCAIDAAEAMTAVHLD